MKKRILSIVLALALCLGLLPAVSLTASAADTGKAIQLVDGGTAANIDGGQVDSIYFGTWDSNAIKWRVLDTKTNTGESGLFLLSDILLERAYFDKTDSISKTWQGSDVQAWCKDFAGEEGAADNVPNAFTADELSAILVTTKSDAECTIYDEGTPNGITVKFIASNGILNGDRVFFLSGEEAINTNYGFNPEGYTEDNARKAFYDGGETWWWLRSPSNRSNQYVGYVDRRGYVTVGSPSSEKRALRPAFNLKLNAVLFTSAANNSGHNSSFAAPATYTGNEWKVTLKDSNNFADGASVSGTTTVVEGYAATELTITHKALSEISADYNNVTAMLTDESGNILYYGSINDDPSATSSTVTIPAGLAAGEYILSVYGEDWNEAERTDYATGTPFTMTITVHKHSWNTNIWEHDVAGHWHPCTTGCPVTENSEKDGYAAHSADTTTGNCVCGFNPLTVTVSQSPTSYTYGDAGVILSAAVSRSDAGSTEGATYAWSDSSTDQTLTLTGLNAGDHSYTCTIISADGYEKTSKVFTVSVGKAASSVTTPPTAATGLTYTGQPKTLLTADGITADGTMQYAVGENAPAADNDWSNDLSAITGTNAGDYTVWYRVKGDANHSDSAPASLTVNIAPAPLAVINATAENREYNGTDKVAITGITLAGIKGSDVVSVDMNGLTGTLSSSDAGAYTTVSLPELTLTGDDATNYTLLHPSGAVTASPNATISKATLNLADYSWSDSTSFVYDGTPKAVMLVGQLPEGVEVSYTGNTGTYAGNYTATAAFALSEEAAKNYVLQNADQQICNWVIQTVAQNPTIVSDVYMKAGDSLDLSTLVSGYQGDTVSFEMSGDAFTLNGNTLTANADAKDRDACSVTVRITGKDMGGLSDFEYAAYEANAITVTVTEMTVPVVSAENITAVYTGSPVPDSAIKGSATADGIAVAGSWSFQNGCGGPVNVNESGEYVVIFSPEDSTVYAPVYVAVTVTVIPATPTGTPTYTKITSSGKTLADAALTAGSITPAGGTIVWDLGDAQTVSANTSYSWTYTPADTTNYNVLTGNITPYTVSYSGGGYTPSTPATESVTVPISGDDNTIRVDASVSGGKATVDEVDLDHLDSVIGDHVDTGTVTIDFSGLNSKEPITTVEIPSDVVKEIAAAVNDPANDAHSFEIVLSDGMSIEFDAVALGEKAAQADGKDITISIEHHEDATLTEAQKNAVGDRPAFDINVTSGGEHISDMGGKISVHLPYELAEGEDPDSIVVFYVDEHGNRERCETSYDPIKKRVNWKTDHLSLYMIDHCPSAAFTDLDVDAWYHEATDYVIENELMGGYGNSVFKPNGNVTRQQVWMILARMSGKTPADMTEAREWAMANGVSDGTNPTSYISRQQFAAMLWRYAKQMGVDVSVGEDTNILSYTDAFDISEYAIPAMQWACGAGMMGGYGDGSLKPLNNATRVHLAKMLMNYLEQ